MAPDRAALHDCRVASVRTFGCFSAVTLVAPRLAAAVEPGQFVMVQVPGGRFLLRRPLSIFAAAGDTVSLLIESRGGGSALLAAAQVGDLLSVQGPLGNGFPLDGVTAAVLVGGGIGSAPLQLLADRLTERGTPVTAAFGFRDARQSRLAGAFAIDHLWVACEDGSIGRKGTVIDLLETLDLPAAATVFACGPDAMVAAVQRWALARGLRGWASLEAHMACGTGSCQGCVVATAAGFKRVCADGPVLSLEEFVHA